MGTRIELNRGRSAVLWRLDDEVLEWSDSTDPFDEPDGRVAGGEFRRSGGLGCEESGGWASVAQAN